MIGPFPDPRTAALALLNDAVKKGGAMASSYVGGLSGAFIPVSEDIGMIQAAESGVLTIDKLEAMTAVCSVGLDMIVVPGDTPAETLSAIIADEAAIGMINKKTTAVRIIPAVGKAVGDSVDFGGLLGRAPVMPLHAASPVRMINRGGRIPAPLVNSPKCPRCSLVGICLPDDAGTPLAWFPGGPDGVRAFHPAALPAFESAFAMTVHKAQGSEFDEVWLQLPRADSRVLSRELLYTGLTRARNALHIAGSADAIAAALARHAGRVSGLGWRLSLSFKKSG